MKSKGIHSLVKTICAASVAALSLLWTSCNVVYEDEPVCNQGLSVRFIYDYNLDYANAFMSQVHCLTVYVYDEAGNYVTTATETNRELLRDENWRMHIDLPEGTYRIVAYGGIACSEASFHVESQPSAGSSITDLNLAMNDDCIGVAPGKVLHPLFYGNIDTGTTYTVGWNDSDYIDATVYMMKDTNSLRILMYNTDGTSINGDDFTFTVTDNNTLFDWNNSLLSTPSITYNATVQGTLNTTAVGDDTEGSGPTFAFAELSLSRFVVDSEARLNIVHKSDNRVALSIPLVKYLMMYKHEQMDFMGNQEFLDRKSRWELSLFLGDSAGDWSKVTLYIEDWRVRINNIEY